MARKARAKVAEAAELAREAIMANARKADASDDRLGDIVLYDLVPGWRGPIADVQTIFRANGLEPSHVLPEPPDWLVAFGRAVDKVAAAVRDDDIRLIDAARGKKGERRTAIVQLARNGRVTSKDLGTVVCPPSSEGGTPYVEREDELGLANRVLKEARVYHEVYVLDDLRRAVVEHIDRWFGLPLRRQPPYVVYWVPAAGGDEIRRLRAAVETCQAGQIELFTGYRSDPESNRTVVNSVNKGLEAQLAEFRAEVDTYTGKNNTRFSTIEELVENSKKLRERAGLYKDILGAAIDNVDEEYAKIEKTLHTRLGIMEAEGETAVAS
jgi:hypothetical protein